MYTIETNKNMNQQKRNIVMKKTKLVTSVGLRIFSFAILVLACSATSKAAVTIAHVANSATGGFLVEGSTTAFVSTGEVSIGFFKNTGGVFAPTSTDWANILSGGVSNAWSNLLTLGYTDVRSVTGATLGTGFDPSFSTGGTTTTNIAMTIQNIPFASLPANTRMYVLGFNAGSWDNTAKTATFGLATQFGAVSAFGHATAAQNFLSPTDNGTMSRNFKGSALTSDDVLIGSLVSSANGTVAMIPEPSSASLLALGVAGLVALRVRRKS
jgi:hypothetical protein